MLQPKVPISVVILTIPGFFLKCISWYDPYTGYHSSMYGDSGFQVGCFTNMDRAETEKPTLTESQQEQQLLSITTHLNQ